MEPNLSTVVSTEMECPKCGRKIAFGSQVEEIHCPDCGNLFKTHAPTPNRFTANKLGKFDLTEMIGDGSFGTTWKALDTELHRNVAVKIPKFLSELETARFFREGRANAQLRHPGIVSIFEVGQFDKVPYLVTEFIQGKNLDWFLANGKLSHAQIANIILQIAEALDYAHAMGVVHRDIKPANIILETGRIASGKAGGADPTWGRPLLMDFGIALHREAESAASHGGQILGTPAYMSPEQASGAGHQADGRTDIYGLGVVLYKLISGKLPFEGETNTLLRRIVDEEPPAPHKWRKGIPQDLETICLKAMAKKPDNRYPRARDFADDLRAYLNHEPIKARPYSYADRLWRWCRRNPSVAGLSLSLLLVLIGGFSGVVWQWKIAEEQRLLAENSFRQVRQTVDDFFSKVGETKLREIPGVQPLRKELLQSAVKYYHSFLAQHPDDQEIRAEMGTYYLLLGDLTKEIGSKTEAIEYYQRSADLWSTLANMTPHKLKPRSRLASAYGKIALVKSEIGKYSDAVKFHQKAVNLNEALVRENAQEGWLKDALSSSLFYLGQAQSLAGNHADAIASLKKNMELWRRINTETPSPASEQGLAESYRSLADLYGQTEQTELALPTYELARALQEKLVETTPANPKLRSDLAKTLLRMAIFYRHEKRYPEALAALRKNLALITKISAENPKNEKFRSDLASSFNHLASIHRAMNRLGEAFEARDTEVKIRKQLVTDNPAVYAHRNSLANSLKNLAKDYLQVRNLKMALRTNQEALKVQRALVEEHPSVVEFRLLLSSILETMGSALAEPSAKEGEEYLRDAIALREKIVGETPEDSDNRTQLALIWNHLGTLAEKRAELPQAVIAYERAVEYQRHVARKFPKSTPAQELLTQMTESLQKVKSQAVNRVPAKD